MFNKGVTKVFFIYDQTETGVGRKNEDLLGKRKSPVYVGK